MKQKLLIAGAMFIFSNLAVAAGMGAGMSAADKAAMHSKMSTMSAADKAAMRANMGAGNMGGSGMQHGAGHTGKGAAGKGTMGGQGNHTGAPHGAMPTTPVAPPATTPAVQAQ